MLQRGHGGRHPSLNEEDIQAFEQELLKGTFKTANQIRQWLNQRGINMTLSGVYYWLRKIKARNKVGRKTHKDQDPDELEDFKQNIVAKLNELDIPSNQRVYVWVSDEHRYGLISTIRRCWTLPGHRVKVPFAMKYQWSYVYGAVEMTRGQTIFIYSPTVSLQCSKIFLEQITATDPDGVHIVIWDRAGFHQKPNASDMLQQVPLLPLPPYCPELNPVEKLWDIVKDHVSNRVFETLEAIEAQISVVLEPFWSCVQRVFDWLGNNWLTRGVATFISQREAAETSA